MYVLIIRLSCDQILRTATFDINLICSCLSVEVLHALGVKNILLIIAI